nr:hypothetical protein [uncultured Acetatifactor sp.]
MNFHKTKMGSIFFNSQLPKLINALQDIASALSKPAPATKPDGTAFPNPALTIRPDGTALPNPAPAIRPDSTAFSDSVPAIKMDGMADPDFLHDLLYWMYETEVFGNRAQLAPFDADVTQAEGTLLPALSQSRELFEQYQAAVSRRNDAEIERAFCIGYRAGAHALLNGLCAPQPRQTGGAPDGQ